MKNLDNKNATKLLLEIKKQLKHEYPENGSGLEWSLIAHSVVQKIEEFLQED